MTYEEKISRNEGVVRAFLKGWDNRDVDACMAQCTEDMSYLNQPLEAIRGKQNVRRMIASIFKPYHCCKILGRKNSIPYVPVTLQK